MNSVMTEDREHVGPDALDVERYRRELTAYCYRMLGSAFEADDAVQETMVRAWRGYARYEGRAPLRSWLFRIATNVCFDTMHRRSRRAMPMDLGPASPASVVASAPDSAEVAWLQPIPDGRVLSADADPAEQAATRESIRLAFVAALQHLPSRQRAVLILRDVLGWHATEVAELLGVTGTSVHSTLQRAHARLATRDLGAPAAPLDDEHRALLRRYVDAFERYDVESLVALLHEDATMSMPPSAFWMQGADVIASWWNGPGAGCRGSRLVPTWANGSPAFALYRPAGPDRRERFGIQVVEVSAGRISGIHSFLEPALFDLFGLPSTPAS